MGLLSLLSPGRALRAAAQLSDRMAPRPFPTRSLVHFSYHKCLTVYFQRIMRQLAEEYAFAYAHCQSDVSKFLRLVGADGGQRFVSVNNVLVPGLDGMTNIRGSHFIRDPRDLVVSGYRYHLWTDEKAFRDPGYDWSNIVADPWFSEHVEPNPARAPRNISYLDYLNTLDSERGMTLELLRLEPALRQMGEWNYGNPHILEMRYEDIIGHEPEAMKTVFRHYGFRPELMARGVQLAERLSLKNQQQGGARHVRNGAAKQWEAEFSPRLRELFKSRHLGLLVKLGYQRA